MTDLMIAAGTRITAEAGASIAGVRANGGLLGIKDLKNYQAYVAASPYPECAVAPASIGHGPERSIHPFHVLYTSARRYSGPPIQRALHRQIFICDL